MMSDWTEKTYTNNLTGEQRRVWRRRVMLNNGSSAYMEVYRLGGRLYWSANVHVDYRPDLSRLSYGTYPAIPSALAVAKAHTSRIAGKALRAARKPRGFDRAA